MLKIITSKIFLIYICASFFSSNVLSSNLLLGATGKVIEVDSSISVTDNYRTLNMGSTVSSTRTVNSWQPGSVVVPAGFRDGFSVSILGYNHTIKLPITIEGIVYGGVTSFTESAPPLVHSPGTSGTQSLLDTGRSAYGVLGNNGEFAREVLSVEAGAPPRTPFTLVKPIIRFSEKEIIQVLEENKPNLSVPVESYVGLMTMSYSFKVQYIAGGPWITETRTFPFSVTLNYVRRHVASFTVENGANQSMTLENGGLVYGGGDASTVTGNAKFIIKAEGYFPEGLNLDVIPSVSNGSSAVFSLANDNGPEHIAYDITCASHSGPMSESNIKCNGSSSMPIVRDGKAVSGSGGIANVALTLDNKEAERIYFSLEVDFVSGYTKSGTYSDVFTVLASPIFH